MTGGRDSSTRRVTLRKALGWVVLGLAAAAVVAAAPGDAATSIRDGPAAGDACNFATSSGDWNTPGNWSCGHVPTTSDQVSVSSGQTAQVGAAAHAGDMMLSGGTIQFTASVGLDVTAVASQSSGTMSVTGGMITGAGTITVGGHFAKTTDGQLTISDTTLTLDDPAPTGTELAGGTVFVNSGTAALHIAQGFTIASGGTLTVNGTATGAITLTGGGVLDGTGQTGSVVNTSGVVAPGTSPGTLTIAGDYTQGAAGTLTEEIASGTQFDRLAVSGNLTVDGTLAIQSGGFTPAPTDTFRIVDGAASRTGTFATVTGASVPPNSYTVAYDAGGVTLLVLGSPPTNTAPPSIPSTGRPGDVVTCDPGTWTRSPTFTFSWTVDAATIGGQTGSTYTLADADVGHTIRCTVRAHDIGGDSEPADSNALSVIPFAPANSAAPSIPASGRPGDAITCNPGAWTGSPTFTFVWTSDGTPVSGQTAQTYTLAAADAGHTIRCRVTAHNAGGDSPAVDSNGLVVPVAAPTNNGAPSIPATGHTGDKVTCGVGSWTGSPTFSFDWTRDGTPIPAQTASTYTLVDADAGHAIRCRVTAHNAGGDSAAIDSNALAASIAVPKNTAAPSIPGNGQPGDVVTCTAGTWTGSPTLTYAWLRNDVPIKGQTGRTYTITNNDVSQAIRCRVGAHNAGGDTTADSNALAVLKSSAVGGCAICILGAPARTNLIASGSGSIVARNTTMLINGKARVSGSGKISAASIGMYPRASAARNFAPRRPVALAHAVKDPLASRSVPSVSQTCRTIRAASSITLRPGVYCALDTNGSQVTLTPGLYLFSGRIHLTGSARLHGSGVTIFLGRHGSLALAGHSALSVSAPASGGYRGLAILFDRHATGALSLADNARAAVTGAIYGKAATLGLSGASTVTCTGAPLAVARLTRAGKSSVLARPGF